jgi:hypothetical protein
MTEARCSFARAADNTPICPLHEHQLTIESAHGDLNPPGVSHLKGTCPVSGQLVVEGEKNSPTSHNDGSAA